MGKVKIKSNKRSNQVVVYYGGELTFDENGITEIDEKVLEQALLIHDDLSIYVEGEVKKEVEEKELLLQKVKENIDKEIQLSSRGNVLVDQTPKDNEVAQVDKIENKPEENTEEIVKKELTYEEELMLMERKDLVDLAIEAGFEEKELKPLNKQKLVAKILTKI